MKYIVRISFFVTAFIFFTVAFPAHAALNISNPIWDGSSFGGYAVTCNAGDTPCSACDAVHVMVNLTNFGTLIIFPLVSVMILYGAFLMIIAAGAEEKFRQGKQIITSAVVGLVIVLLSWVVVNELLQIITGGANLPWNTIECTSPPDLGGRDTR
ncbi:MAG: hypothetical protein AAB631_02480 [Patescibacteria group bacterium]